MYICIYICIYIYVYVCITCLYYMYNDVLTCNIHNIIILLYYNI